MAVAIVTGSGGLIGSESVAYLVEAGFDVIGIENDPGAQAIVTAIVGLARSFGLDTVAEGGRDRGRGADPRRARLHQGSGLI